MAIEALHVCHECKRIGSEQEAWAHRAATGHETVELDELTSAAIRAQWNRDRAGHIAAFRRYARLRAAHPDHQEGRRG